MGRPLHAEERARRLGAFLRRVREERKFSLDAVAEMSAGYAERLTKSHLSRIENGQAEPSFRKLFVLSRIYGVPLVSLAERFEVDLERELQKVDLEGKPDREVHELMGAYLRSGRAREALAFATAALERLAVRPGEDEATTRAWARRFHLGVINALLRLGHYESARAEAEAFLRDRDLELGDQLVALQFVISACYRLGHHTMATLLLEQARRSLECPAVPPRMKADFETLYGNVLLSLGRYAEALGHYDEALSLYEALPDPFEAAQVRANRAAACIHLGMYDQARQELQIVLDTSRKQGYARLEATALSHLAWMEYRQGELQQAERWALRSNMLAREHGHAVVLFRNSFYLWRIAEKRNDQRAARAHAAALRSLSTRVDEHLPELAEYRALTGGGA